MVVEISMNNLSEMERGYLFGMYEGDGYAIHEKKTRHYTIEFYLDSIRNVNIQSYLISLLEKIGLSVLIMKDKRFNCNRLKIRSKRLFNILNNEQNEENQDFEIGFLSGMIDAEGYVNFPNSTINIVNTDIELISRCKSMLLRSGIDTKLRKRKKSKKDKKDSFILHIPVAIKALNTNSVKLNSE